MAEAPLRPPWFPLRYRRKTPPSGPLRSALTVLRFTWALCLFGPAAALGQDNPVVVRGSLNEVQGKELCRQTADLLLKLPVSLTCAASDPAMPFEGEALLTVQVAAPGPTSLLLLLDAGAHGQLTRALPIQAGTVDQAALESMAAIVDGGVRTLLSGQPLPSASEPPINADPAPDVADVEADGPVSGEGQTEGEAETETETETETEESEQELDLNSTAAANGPRPEAGPPPSTTGGGDPSTDVDAGYGLSLFSPALVFHGVSLHVLHRRPGESATFVVEGMVFLPFARTVERPSLDARLTSYLLRAMVGLEWPLTDGLSARAVAGLLAQRVTSEASRAREGVSPAPSNDYQGFGLALMGALRLLVLDPLFLSLHVGLDLDPAKLELGVTRDGDFARLFRSHRLRPQLSLHVGASF